MSYEPTCGVCGKIVPPDTDHVKVSSETVFTDDRNDVDFYYLHPDCAHSIFGGWWEP